MTGVLHPRRSPVAVQLGLVRTRRDPANKMAGRRQEIEALVGFATGLRGPPGDDPPDAGSIRGAPKDATYQGCPLEAP